MSETIKCPHCGVVVDASEEFCADCFADLRGAGASGQTSAVRVETQKKHADATDPEPKPKPAQVPTSVGVAAAPPKSADSAKTYRPRLRPPMAVLSIVDDDLDDVEKIRLRRPETTIGRRDCDIEIPHDKMMSSQHAKLIRKYVDGMYRWYLKDLDSTNRTLLKVRSGKLKHNAEIMIGVYRYRFNAAPQGVPNAPEFPDHSDEPQVTMGFKSVSQDDLRNLSPSLIRITPSGETEEFKFNATDEIIGSSAAESSVVIDDDPTISNSHLRLVQDAHRRWHLEDLDSLNGVWIAIDEFELDKNGQFQLGEQRFSIRFP